MIHEWSRSHKDLAYHLAEIGSMCVCLLITILLTEVLWSRHRAPHCILSLLRKALPRKVIVIPVVTEVGPGNSLGV